MYMYINDNLIIYHIHIQYNIILHALDKKKLKFNTDI